MPSENFGLGQMIGKQPSNYERLQELRERYIGLNRNIDDMTNQRLDLAREILETAQQFNKETQTDIMEMERLVGKPKTLVKDWSER